MKILLDTHIFLWFISNDPRLLPAWKQQIEDPANDVFLSVVSIWEVGIKYHLGKIPLPQPPETYLPQQRIRHLIQSLPLGETELRHLPTLPPLHRDPFDRVLICQALEHNLTIATVDSAILAYPVDVLGD